MSDAFESEVMDDLFYESAEGPARPSYGDEFEELDELEGEFEGFEDELEEYDELEDYGDELEEFDSMEDAVADALDAEDTDEFFRRIRRIARGAASIARRAAPIVGRIARGVSRVASVIPLPQAQAIGRIAGAVGRVLPADELDALDAVIDLAEDEDAMDAAAPVVAGLAVRRAAPAVARAPQAVRRQVVRAATQATRALTRRAGPQAARAVPPLIRGAMRVLRRRRLRIGALVPGLRRIAARVIHNPRIVRQLAQSAARGPVRRMRPRGMRPRGMRARP
jgi:hypothetical protein